MNRPSAIAAVLVAFGSITCGSHGRAESFRTAKITVCSNRLLDFKSPCSEVKTFTDLDRGIFPAKRIDVKVTILCEKDAMAFLRENGFLPVKIAVYRNGIRKTEDIEVGITQENWDTDGPSLTSLYDDQGNFAWRTRFYVNLADANSISVEVNDATDKTSLIGNELARLNFSFAR